MLLSVAILSEKARVRRLSRGGRRVTVRSGEPNRVAPARGASDTTENEFRTSQHPPAPRHRLLRAGGFKDTHLAEDGFGLIDAVLALVILMVILIATSNLVSDVLKQASHAKEQVSATEIAEQWLERLANDPLATLQGDINHSVPLTSVPDVVAGIGYSASALMAWADTGASQNACTSGNPPQVILATVTVSWGQGQTLDETTIIDPPYGTAVPNDGYISVQIIGASGTGPPTGVTNLKVTINDGVGGSLTTYTPDVNGCVFQQEVPGTYTVSLSSSSGGWIDWQENTAPSTSLTVVSGVTSPWSFHYDQSSTVAFTSSAVPIATGMPVSVGNGQLTPVPWKTVVTGGTTSATLFPYQSGYSVWYGDCLAEEPSAPASVAVSPGGSSTATITGLVPLQLQVTKSGSPLYGATANAVVKDSADGCPADTYGLSPASGTTPSPALSLTEVIPETYSVTVVDPGNGLSTTVTLQVTATGVVDGGTTYPDGTPVPVTAP